MLTEPVEALSRLGIERDITGEEVSSAPAVTALGRRREIGDALAEQLCAVGTGETHDGWERHEALFRIVVHLDDQVTVAQARPVVEDQNLDLALGSSVPDQGASGRLRDRATEGRAHPNAVLAPCVDLENLAALERGEPGLAGYESCQSPNLFTCGSDRPALE